MNAALSEMQTPLQAALQLAEEHGIPVFPCTADKKPHTTNGFKDASTNLEQITAWWNHWPDALVGIPTGAASKLLVIDVDPDGLEWYRANAQRLACGRIHHTRRGFHLLYRMPTTEVRNSASKIAKGIDVRGEGGYLVWWPATGLQAVGDLEDVTEPPAWLVADLLRNKPTLVHASTAPSSGQILDGGRNDYLSREAFRMRKQGSTVDQIAVVLSALNATKCDPPLAADEVLAIAQGKTAIGPAAVSIDDFRAYMPTHTYICMPDGALWPASSVNSCVPPVDVGAEKPIPASAWLDQKRAVQQMTWVPSQPQIIMDQIISDGGWLPRQGWHVFNLYRPPQRIDGDPTQATPWLHHLQRIYPEDAEHVIQWLAHRVQRPGEKINHALVLGGAQGIGKDTVLEPVKYAVGPWNFMEVSPAHLLGRFNGFVKSVILRVSEARDLGDVDRYGFYEHLKTYTAAPPDVLRCDEKNVREHPVVNVMGVIITTNHKTDGIYLPADDRRHYVAWSDLSREQFVDDYWRTLYGWYASGGTGHVAAYLACLDLTGFDPKAPPPKTTAFWDIVDANRAPEDAELADVIEALKNPQAVTLLDLMTWASDSFREWLKDRRNRRQIPHRLESAGYIPVRSDTASDGLWKVDGKRQAVYAKKDLTPRDRIEAARQLCRRGGQ